MVESLCWDELPASVVGFVEQSLGETVVDAASQRSDWTPDLADVVTTASGASAFVKAVDHGRFPEAFDLLRREAGVLWMMPQDVPCAPILASMNDGEWIAVLTRAIDGCRHPEPSDAADHLRVLDAVCRLPEDGPEGLPQLCEEVAPLFDVWPEIAEHVVIGAWHAADHVEALAELSAHAVSALDGNSLVHADLGLDAVLIHEGGATIVNWSWASIGCSWFDAMTYLLDVRVHGGAVSSGWFEHPAFARATHRDLSAQLAGMAAYYLEAASWPPAAGMPLVRQFQRQQGLAALTWLREREDLS